MSVPSRSKNAPTRGPSLLAATSATDPGRRIVSMVIRRPPSSRCRHSSHWPAPASGPASRRPASRSPACAGFRASTSSKPARQALGEQVVIGDRRRVVVGADVADAGLGEHDDHHRHAGQRAERQRLRHPGAGDVRRLRVAGHVARLDVDPRARSTTAWRATDAGSRLAIGRDHGEDVDRRLRDRREHLLADHRDALRRDRRSPTGATSRAPAKRLPPAGSSSLRRLTGIASGTASTGTPSAFVVHAQRAAQGGDVGVVDRSADGSAAAPEVARAGSSCTSNRRPRLRRRKSGDGGTGEGPSTRWADATSLRASPIAPLGRGDELPSDARGAWAAPAGRGRDRGDREPPHRVAREVARRHVLGNRDRRQRSSVGVALEVVELAEQLERPDAVGDGVVHLHHQRRRCVPFRDALDEYGLPQRPRGVERRGVEHRREVEQLADRARLGEADAAEVEVEVEVGVGDPLRRADAATPAPRRAGAGGQRPGWRGRTRPRSRSKSGTMSSIEIVTMAVRVRGSVSPRNIR